MKLTFHSTHCPKCKVLEKKLKAKNVEYELNTDVQTMLGKGFSEVPVLEVDGTCLNFKQANEWINNLQEE